MNSTGACCAATSGSRSSKASVWARAIYASSQRGSGIFGFWARQISFNRAICSSALFAAPEGCLGSGAAGVGDGKPIEGKQRRSETASLAETLGLDPTRLPTAEEVAHMLEGRRAGGQPPPAK